MKYMDRIAKRENADQRFAAALHDKQMGDTQGRIHGIRQGHMMRMKARRGAH